jgi:translation initiation factor 1
MGDDDRLVWSSKQGKMCPDCRRPVAECDCKKSPETPQGDGVVRVAKETKGRRGKTVTVVTGVPLDAAKLTKLGKRLKRQCGSGGTVREGRIEIQGDHRDTVVKALEGEGYTVRRSGG